MIEKLGDGHYTFTQGLGLSQPLTWTVQKTRHRGWAFSGPGATDAGYRGFQEAVDAMLTAWDIVVRPGKDYEDFAHLRSVEEGKGGLLAHLERLGVNVLRY